MEVFARTFLAAATHAGLAPPAIDRHFPLYRRCLGGTDPLLVVSRCLRPDRPWAGEHLLALTRRRLVVTQESRVLRRIRLHLDAPVTELSDAWWRADPGQATAEFAVTGADGVRARFRLRAWHPRAPWHLDAAFAAAFGPLAAPPAASPAVFPAPAPPRLAAPRGVRLARPVRIPNMARVTR